MNDLVDRLIAERRAAQGDLAVLAQYTEDPAEKAALEAMTATTSGRTPPTGSRSTSRSGRSSTCWRPVLLSAGRGHLGRL